MTRLISYVLAGATVFVLAAPAFANDLNVAGTWITEDGDAHIAITDCGDGTPCGKLVWFESDNGMSEKDSENPDPAMRDNPLLGTQIVWGFEPKGDKWKSGRIYDAGKGKVYKSKMSLNEDGTLKVRGCVGPICQGQNWVKLEADTP